MEQVNQFVSLVRERVSSETLMNVFLSVLILISVVTVQLVIGVVVNVLHFIPIVDDLLMLIGLVIVSKYVYNNLLYQEDRDATIESIRYQVQTFIGKV